MITRKKTAVLLFATIYILGTCQSSKSYGVGISVPVGAVVFLLSDSLLQVLGSTYDATRYEIQLTFFVSSWVNYAVISALTDTLINDSSAEASRNYILQGFDV